MPYGGEVGNSVLYSGEVGNGVPYGGEARNCPVVCITEAELYGPFC